ncbi:expressed conserved protein [Echinococcus multilocularis]|uniref:Expressed conserved protein n=1 Tax=Echinococcus multilocularis TaxID=6211 RepID=A0A068Y409_ECHMU|nr:expressed conserved protein [Echinococcus multilocularis]
MESGSSLAGEKLLNATEKITDTLSSYFSTKLTKSCSKLRNLDPQWFDSVIRNGIEEFKRESMSQIVKLIEEMEVSKKAAIIDVANTTCAVKRPWRPSGDPEEDTNALIYDIEKEHRDLLVSESSKLYRILRSKADELKTAHRTEERSLESIEALAKTLDRV